MHRNLKKSYLNPLFKPVIEPAQRVSLHFFRIMCRFASRGGGGMSELKVNILDETYYFFPKVELMAWLRRSSISTISLCAKRDDNLYLE